MKELRKEFGMVVLNGERIESWFDSIFEEERE